MDIAKTVVIGGGVVGLAVAAELSRSYDDVFVLEALPRIGLGASSRNSGVIHAGIYYPSGSLKAIHSVRGSQLLYHFSEDHRIPHRRIGKLIVADDEDQLPALQDLKRRGEQNGVQGLEIIDRDRIRKLEPNVVSPLALHSPNTGIIDADELIKTLARVVETNGGHILTGNRVLNADVKDSLVLLQTAHETVVARTVVNAAGLYADEVAGMFGNNLYTIYPCRGEYAELPRSRSDLVNGLVYPLPPSSGHGLGVHLTKNLAGTLLLGPNSRYVTGKEDYEGGRADLESFYESVSRVVPAIRLKDLRLSYSGLRARLQPESDHSFVDFVIGPDPQFPFVIHAIGMESPGLTAALSIGVSVAQTIQETLG